MGNKNKILLVFILPFFLKNISIAQNSDPPFLKYLYNQRVDSVMNTLSIEEKIAQLIWIDAYSNHNLSYDVNLSNLIKRTGIGGVIFFEGNAPKQTEMINYFRELTKVPLIFATDGEWGLGMRLDGVMKFPFQMTLGAIQNDSLIYEMGSAIAGQFKRAGLNINLAPVADVNSNPDNPVINFRSFGEEPDNVSRKSLMYMKGLQDNGIISVAKHFPGHGDTQVDSHINLPVIDHTKSRLDSVDLVPFKTLIENGISCVMPGHLWIRALEKQDELPATLSHSVLTDLLKNELSFKGLIISDAMTMGGLIRYTDTGKTEIMALKAGIDVLEVVADPEVAIKNIVNGVKEGDISAESIDEKCRKVLAAKYQAGLFRPFVVEKENLNNDLSPKTSEALIRNLYSSAITVLNNDQNMIPLKNLEKTRIATLAINASGPTLYQKRISKYIPADDYNISVFTKDQVDSVLKKLENYDIVITGIFKTDQRSTVNFGIPPGLDNFLNRLNNQNRCILTWFGNPYAIDRIPSAWNSSGLIITYQDNNFTRDLSAQLIFGGIGAKGFLPVTINKKYPAGSGIITPGLLRLQYGIPESDGISSRYLNDKIDSIANYGIDAGAYPGCEIMIAKDGLVMFQKTYGYQTYDDRISISENDLFDLASVTKISASMAGLLLLDTEGKFSPDKTLGYYLPEFRKSNKSNLVMRDMLTHQAGLVAWIPFWKETVKKNGKFRARTFKHEYSERYPLKVAEDLYIFKNYNKKIFKEIKKSKVSDQKRYLYSDLTFIIVPQIINKLSGEEWYDFVTDSVYHKIGAYDLCFNPYLKYPLSRIVPTEYDSLFRKQQLHGTVHDEGAAMLGGISGHAGLFATANDLMKLMELYRRMGNYGGEQIFSKDIMKEYTRVQFPENDNRRGIGFDKPLLDNSELSQDQSYPSKSASPESFGHSGYTGTFVWIDPAYNLTYIFFCNRVYPTRNNNLLSDLNIRTNILQVIYDSIIKQ